MGLFSIITPLLYPVLALLWGTIIVLSVHQYRRNTALTPHMRILVVFIGVMAVCFFVECIYFGIRYGSALGQLPAHLNVTLERPEFTFIPKFLHFVAASVILAVFFRYFLPRSAANRIAAESRYQELVDSLDAVVWEADAETFIFTYVSPQAERILGYPVSAWYEKNFWADHIHPDDKADAVAFCEKATGMATDHRFEYRFMAANGDAVWLQDTVAVVRGPDGRTYLRGLLVDITGQRLDAERQAAYRKRVEEQSHVLVEIATDPDVAAGERTPALLRVAALASKTLGVERMGIWLLKEDDTELEGALLYDGRDQSHTVGTVLQARDYPAYFEAMKTERYIDAEDVHTDPRTAEFSENYTGPLGIGAMLDAPIRLRGRIVGTICNEHVGGPRHWHADEKLFASMLADQVAQILLNAERREEQARQRRLIAAIEQAGEGVVIMDRDGTVEYANAAYELHTGLPRTGLEGKRFPMLEAWDEDEALAQLRQAWKNGEVWRGRIESRRNDGNPLTLEVTWSPVLDDAGALVNFVAVLLDVTYEQSLEAKLRHTQRMESIGRLAGGIAHDFNNILQAIQGNVELAKTAGRDDPEFEDFLDGAQEAAKKAATLTGQLLAFSRKQLLQPADLAVNKLVGDFVRMASRIIGEDIELRFIAGADAGVVRADGSQLEQVLLNLCVNARDAMPRGGVLTIETKAALLERDLKGEKLGDSTLGAGKYARITVSDTGCGMDRETQARLFEPFFTTKEFGTGTGLGLATAYGIIRQHNGQIHVYSEQGKGTTFSVYLPMSSAEIGSDGKPAEAVAALGGTEEILVVDDNEDVRRVAAALLKAAGYGVEMASGGEEALEIFRNAPDRFDLVLLDVIMPGMNGQATAEAIAAIRPVPVLFASGFSGTVLSDRITTGPLRAILHKPFQRRDLLSAVRKLLDEAALTA